MRRPENLIIVIFGASGDLSKRKLIPALIELYNQKLMPQSFAILGVSRTKYSDETFRSMMIDSMNEFNTNSDFDDDLKNSFVQNLYFYS